MSSQDVKLRLNNKVNVSDKYDKVVDFCSLQTTQSSAQCNGVASQGTIQFNQISLPSLGSTIAPKTMKIGYNVNIGANALPPMSANGALGANGATMCLNFLPLFSVATTLQLIINSNPTTINPRQIWTALQRTLPKSFWKETGSVAPVGYDSTPLLVPSTAGYSQSCQTLSSYDNCYGGESRASFTPIGTFQGADGKQYYKFFVQEPVLISPLSVFPNDVGLPLLNSLSIQYIYNMTDLKDMVKMAGLTNQALPNGFNVYLDDVAYILFDVLNVDPSVSSIPNSVTMPYENMDTYQTSMLAMASPYAFQAWAGQNLQTIKQSATPDLIWVYAHVTMGQRTTSPGLWPDSTLALGTSSVYQTNIINITYNNRNGLLSQCNLADLYFISKNNGITMSYEEWVKSPVIVISPTRDFGLQISSDGLVGEPANTLISVTASFNNQNYVDCCTKLAIVAGGANPYANAQVELVATLVFRGSATITPNLISYNISPISGADVEYALGGKSDVISSEMTRPTVEGRGLATGQRGILTHMAEGSGRTSGGGIVGAGVKKLAPRHR